MMPYKIAVPLFVGIIFTFGFNLSPILFGGEMTMNICFLLYAGFMLALSFADRRVLGYATVLSACNPANSIANLSFSLLLAILTIFKEHLALGRVIQELGKSRWWRLFLLAFLLIGLSVPFWNLDMRNMITEFKQALSRLGYLVVFPLAVGLTIRNLKDGCQALSLLCLMSIAFLVIFYLFGQTGHTIIVAVEGGDTIGVEQFIGNISLNFVRTQVCIPIAALAAVALALGMGFSGYRRALLFYLASGFCVFMITSLASIGSFIALLSGMGVVTFGYFKNRISPLRILLGIVLLSAVGLALYWVAFQSDTMIAKRIELKTKEINTTGIDRIKFWEEGIRLILITPFGSGWDVEKILTHNDFMLYFVAYGWLTGLLYLWGSLLLFLWLWRMLHRQEEVKITAQLLRTHLLAGLGVLTVYSLNAFLDMLSANIGYYQTLWALILTPGTVVAVTGASKQSKKIND